MTPSETMSAAILEHKPVRIYALLSGGNDSTVSTHLAMNNGAHEVLHINTGIGIPETREFVRETCKAFGWPLREEHPPAKTYRQMVLERGFPGPGAHRYAYSWLKERALRKVVREAKKNPRDRVMLVTGVRNLESARRMGYVQPILRMGATVWTAPAYSFSKLDLHAARTAHNLPQSEVAKNLGMSGECLCGSFARPGEFERIERFYPKVAQEIRDLEAEAKTARKPHAWGQDPNPGALSGDLPFMPMCVGCPTKRSMEVAP